MSSEINDFDIKKLPGVLKKGTLLARYHGLISDANSNCRKLDAVGIKKATDLFKVVNSSRELVILAKKTGISQTYLQLLTALLNFRRFKPFSLKKMQGIDSGYLETLASHGIKNTSDLLLASKTKQDRIKLAKYVNIPIESLERIIRLADLNRLPGHLNLRAVLYLEAGLDSIEEISRQDPIKMRDYLITFVEKTKIAKIAPLPKELETQIAWAKLYPIIIQY